MQSIFKRYEKKYLLTEEQGAKVKEIILRHMVPDTYGEYLVQNLYYDTENWDVIRASLQKPVYKEKLRLRCYGEVGDASELFLELKKKCKGIVYKRRIILSAKAFAEESIRAAVSQTPSQIAREIDFYLQSKAVSQKIYIAYQRLAFSGVEDEGLRITFDTDVRFRLNDLSLLGTGAEQNILSQGNILMEVKTLGGMPLWLAAALSKHGVFPVGFSKFGVCYTDYILKQMDEKRKVILSA